MYKTVSFYGISILIFCVHLNVFCQTENDLLKGRSQGKLVTYSANTSFCDFIDYIEFLYAKYDNKKVEVKSNCRFPIGLELNNIFYKEALVQICKKNNFKMEFDTEKIIINEILTNHLKNTIIQSNIDTKQIKVSAIIFEANLDRMDERGVDWNLFISKHGLESSFGFSSISKEESNFGLRVATDFGKFSGYTSAMLKLFESNNLGKITSKMSIVVNDGQKSRMQVGSDISVKQLDFAGNVTDAFFPTGTIINVEPNVSNYDSVKTVHLKIHVERSIPAPSELSTEISRTVTDTEILLRDNEEMIIGSLLLDEELIIREGIPILKDLPWWVLGLRYLTGYNSKLMVRKDVVMLIRAEILPSFKERFNKKSDQIKNRIREDKKEIDSLKFYNDLE